MKNVTTKLFGIYLLFILMLMGIGSVKAQSVPDEGLVVVEFNASFAPSKCEYLEELTDCEVAKVDIQKSADLQKKYKIVVVPTLIILVDGEERGRVQANIMMQLEATKEEVQGIIDEILMEAF